MRLFSFILSLSFFLQESLAQEQSPVQTNLARDTSVIREPVNDETLGSHRKRATVYKVVSGSDTSKFRVFVWESNESLPYTVGEVYFELNFDRNKTYATQKAELKQMLPVIAREYILDSLKVIGPSLLISFGDLTIAVSKQLEKEPDRKMILKDYRKVTKFLLRSQLAKEMNELFAPFKLKVKRFSIEHVSSSKPSYITRYIKIETPNHRMPTMILDGGIWIEFERITSPNR
jgi:hypothetical protein